MRGNILKTQSGETLIMILVAAAIGSVVALGIATIMSNAHLSQNNVQYRAEADAMLSEIRAYLSSPDGCRNTFGGLTVGPSVTLPINQIKDDTNAVRFEINKPYGDRAALLSSMNLSGFVNGAQAGKATMTLTVNTSTNKQSLGAQQLVRTVDVALEMNGANAITTCVAVAKMSDGLWQRQLTNLNNIFFVAPSTGGNVGIGEPNPTARLDVVGPAGAALRMRDGNQALGKAIVSDANGNATWGNPAYSDRAGHADTAGSTNYAATANEANVANFLRSQNSGNYITINYLGTSNNFGIFVDNTYVKTFVINHPSDPERYLVHGTLEGPEGAVFYRGQAALRDGYARVDLPSYFEGLTRPDGRTVQLTAIDGYDPLTVRTRGGLGVKDGYFEVTSNRPQSTQKFDWIVMAVRADVAPLVVEPKKSEYAVYGMGPYTYGELKKGDTPARRGESDLRALREAICQVNPTARVCSKE